MSVSGAGTMSHKSPALSRMHTKDLRRCGLIETTIGVLSCMLQTALLEMIRPLSGLQAKLSHGTSSPKTLEALDSRRLERTSSALELLPCRG